MTRQIRYILITVGVLVVLVLALLLVKYLPSAGTKKSASGSSSASSAADITLTKIDTSKIKMVQVTNAKGTFTIRKNGSNYAVDELGNAPVSQASVENLVEEVASLSASQKVASDSSNLDQYGLKTPKSTVNIETTDGKTTTITTGGSSPIGNGVYAMLKGDSNVYLVTSTFGDDVTQAANKLIDLVITSIENTNFGKVTKIAFGGAANPNPVQLAIDPDAASTYSATTDSSGNVQPPAYTITSPGNYASNSENLTTLLNGLSSFSASDFVTSDMSDQTLEKYGLKNPAYTISYTYNGKENTVSFSQPTDVNGSSYLYVRTSDKNVIYDVATSTVSFYKWGLSDLAASLVFTPPNIDDVKTVTVTAGSNTWIYGLNGAGDSLKVTEGSKTLNTSNFRNFYENLIGFTNAGVSSEGANGALQLKITFTYHNASKRPDVIEFHKIDDYKSEYVINGQANFYVKSTSVNQVIQYAQDIINGKSVPEP